MKEHQEFVVCDCYSHAIEVEYMNDPCEETYINMWYDGKRSNTPLLARVQAAWEMLTRGYVIDGFVLKKEKVIRLRNALNTILDGE